MADRVVADHRDPTPAGTEPLSRARRDPGERGSLTIRDKVAQRLAARAALDTPGVERHAAGLGKLTGRDLPRVRVMVSANRVRATIDIAVPWSCPLPQVGAAVRRNVADALSTLAGLQVDGVDVAVTSVVNRSDVPVTDQLARSVR